MPSQKPTNRVLSGWKALAVQLRFCAAVLYRCLFRRRRYPLLFLRVSKNGFLKTLSMLQDCRLTKVIKAANKYHFSLVEPGWPSEAYDLMIANGGLNVGGAGTPAKAQIDLAILAITRACGNGCEHCYERFNVNGRDTVPLSRWQSVIAEIQSIGVSVVALSGGEPLLRFENTLQLVETADKRRSDIHLYTSGLGVRPARVTALVDAGLAGVAVGLDHFDREKHDVVRGRKGAYDDAVEALQLFRDAGILTFVNTCITKQLVASDGLWRFYELLNKLGVGAVQLLEPKPCGGYATQQIKTLYGLEERKATMDFFEATTGGRNHDGYPAVYFPAFTEAPENLGCMMGGLSHLHIDSRGNVEPCVFLPVAFGNITDRSFLDIYRDMRKAVPRPLHKRCPALQLAERVGFDPEEGKELPLAYADVREEWGRMFG
jgi:MoaA/NifB/PqqE/SkfB family radical SAM enzyme